MYEIWDTVTGNRLLDVPSKVEALHWLLGLMAQQGEGALEGLALGTTSGGGSVLSGEALQDAMATVLWADTPHGHTSSATMPAGEVVLLTA